MYWINHFAVLVIVITASMNQVSSSGLFEFRLKSFRNDVGKDNIGACCSGQMDMKTGICTGACRTKFRVCLKHYQAKIDLKTNCTFGEFSTLVLGENNIQLMGQKEYDKFENPMSFPFEFAWPGAFTMIVEAWHENNNTRIPDILISRHSIQRVLDVSPDWTEDKHDSAHSTIQYDFRVTCSPQYYGSGCKNFCRPRNDSFGHFACSSSGDRLCLTGWQGSYCDKPRCTLGCDEQHGHCTEPNQCMCQSGWKGALCNECEPYPGCVHGTCNTPWQCICNEGWGGLFCNQDLNYCTNHRPCQNGGTCFNTGEGSYTCQCAPGFNGTDCDIPASDCTLMPCQNGGSCHEDIHTQSYRCECRKGWIGKHCEKDTLTCADNPCTRGKCRDTTSGFKCEIQMNECDPDPCQNGGECIRKGEAFKCNCPSGFMGMRCEINFDDCQGNPCQNGGTCVDMINQFRCQCVPGFIGALCDSKVDLCLTKPCANGGSCTNLKNDYRCTCKPGFTGRDCSVDIDECASQPCENGGTCVNRVNSFQCVCSGGYQGTQCEEESIAPPSWSSDGSLSRHIASGQLHEGRSEDANALSNTQIILIILISITIPTIVIIGAIIVFCMKQRRKRAQDKDDAEARKQNEQNASHTLSHHHNSISAKRGSSATIGLDSSSHMIKNTWDKSVNNISSSMSVDECLMNASIYGGAVSQYSDNSDCLGGSAAMVSPLQRARSQKQLNTDIGIKQRASQIITPKEMYNHDSKRVSALLLSEGGQCGLTSAMGQHHRWLAASSGGGTCGQMMAPSLTMARQLGQCSPPHI